MEQYLSTFKKYVEFDGRATRSEYWTFVLVNMVIGSLLGMISPMVGDSSGLLGSLFSLLVFLPSVAVGVRRLHDLGKSGWMMLLMLLPVIGWLWLLILFVLAGQAGENAYGPDPKGASK